LGLKDLFFSRKGISFELLSPEGHQISHPSPFSLEKKKVLGITPKKKRFSFLLGIKPLFFFKRKGVARVWRDTRFCHLGI